MSDTTVAHTPLDTENSPPGLSARSGDEPPVGFRWICIPRSLLDADIPDIAFTVAGAMEDLDNGPDGCYARTGTLANRLGIAVSHVRDARMHLRGWTMPVVTRGGRKGRKLRPDDDGLRVRIPSTALYGSYKLAPRLTRSLCFVVWCNDRDIKVTARALSRTVKTERKQGITSVSLRTAQTLLRDLAAAGWVIRTGAGSDTEWYAQAAPINRHPADVIHTPGNGEADTVHDPGNRAAGSIPTPGSGAAETLHIPGSWEVDGVPIETTPRQPSGGDPGNWEAGAPATERRRVDLLSTST